MLVVGVEDHAEATGTDAIIEPDGDQRDEATIYLDLARAAGVPLFGSRAAQRVLEFSRRLSSIGGNRNGLPQKALLSLLLRITGQGSLRRLLAEPHGRLRPPYRGEDFLGRRVVTEDRKVHLAPPVLREHARRLDADFEAQLAAAGHLRLITRRAVTTHNSWTHNIEAFVAGGRSTNYLYMHREDMRRLGLRAGDIVDVSSATATVRLPLRVCDDLMPGTVALPHGWGHQHALGLNVAARTTGVNVNLLAADGPEALERVSGMARLTGISVRVRRAAGRRDTGDWSGVPQGEEDRTPDEAVLEVGTS